MRRWASLAGVLAVLLASAPLPRALRVECDLCPPTCPMHRQHESGAPGVAKCHGTAAAIDHASAPGTGRTLTRPPCGNHGIIGGLVMPPMIVPHGLVHEREPRNARTAAAELAARDRLADPPDSPPPIALRTEV